MAKIVTAEQIQTMKKNMEVSMRQMFNCHFEDAERPGLVDTPRRFLDWFDEATLGYQTDPESILKTFDEEVVNPDEMILVSHIAFTSLCEHHLLPFSGVAHVAYIPGPVGKKKNKAVKIVGLSKLARLVDVFARRLQVQERLTRQITDTLDKVLKPKGVACVVQADHSCMSCRGVRKSGAVTTTSSLVGEFLDLEVRMELFQLINLNGGFKK